ncbi:MAG: carbonic anhydrase [Planctomycetaceae bacterium]|nr:carbonic anhydrase [Planctomycetaceae bacterium]
MHGRHITRRGLMLTAGSALVSGAALAHADEVDAAPSNADEALERLKTGNARFARGESIHRHQSHEWRKRLTKGQNPFATILSCSDSRVPVELVFDQGFGDLFSVRIAGNIIAEDVVGSVQYAARHLHTRLFVVMGHESCGAVTAAVDALLGKLDEPEHIAALVRMITPGLTNLDRKKSRNALITAAVEANVLWSMRQLARMPEAQKHLREKRIALVGAVYDLDSGTVRFVETPPGLLDGK